MLFFPLFFTTFPRLHPIRTGWFSAREFPFLISGSPNPNPSCFTSSLSPIRSAQIAKKVTLNPAASCSLLQMVALVWRVAGGRVLPVLIHPFNWRGPGLKSGGAIRFFFSLRVSNILPAGYVTFSNPIFSPKRRISREIFVPLRSAKRIFLFHTAFISG
jgi:hypothetical protein